MQNITFKTAIESALNTIKEQITDIKALEKFNPQGDIIRSLTDDEKETLKLLENNKTDLINLQTLTNIPALETQDLFRFQDKKLSIELGNYATFKFDYAIELVKKYSGISANFTENTAFTVAKNNAMVVTEFVDLFRKFTTSYYNIVANSFKNPPHHSQAGQFASALKTALNTDLTPLSAKLWNIEGKFTVNHAKTILFGNSLTKWTNKGKKNIDMRSIKNAITELQYFIANKENEVTVKIKADKKDKQAESAETTAA